MSLKKLLATWFLVNEVTLLKFQGDNFPPRLTCANSTPCSEKKKREQLRKKHVITILKVCINLKHPGMIPQRFHHQVTAKNALRKLQLMFQK